MVVLEGRAQRSELTSVIVQGKLKLKAVLVKLPLKSDGLVHSDSSVQVQGSRARDFHPQPLYPLWPVAQVLL